MIVVVDTNIVISGILSPFGKLSQLLIDPPPAITYYSPIYLREEIDAHSEKIKRIAKFDDEQYNNQKNTVLHNISFVKETDIAHHHILKAVSDLAMIDPDDILFFALSYHLNAPLWTGDKKLIRGLGESFAPNIISTDKLFAKYA